MPKRPAPLEPFLKALQGYYQQCRVLPTFEEMKDVFGVGSKGVAAYHAERLRKAGFLEYACGSRLAPTKKFFERPLVGRVPAGHPTSATDPLGESMSIDDFLVKDPAQTVLIAVHGDSMIGRCIMPDDIIVVERRNYAQPEDIVVAVVDGELTVKTLKKHGKKGWYLHPENALYPDIWPSGQLEIYGVMVGLIRRGTS